MKRRSFFKKTTTTLAGLGLTTNACANTTGKKVKAPFKVCGTLDQQEVFFYAEVIQESIKVVHIADTHLFMDDERGIPYQVYSNRMAKAYNETTHFQTRIKTNPAEAFEQKIAPAIKAISLGEEKVSMHQVMLAIWEAHYPYFTEKGQQVFVRLKKELPTLVKGEMVMNN